MLRNTDQPSLYLAVTKNKRKLISLIVSRCPRRKLNSSWTRKDEPAWYNYFLMKIVSHSLKRSTNVWYFRSGRFWSNLCHFFFLRGGGEANRLPIAHVSYYLVWSNFSLIIWFHIFGQWEKIEFKSFSSTDVQGKRRTITRESMR